MNKKEVSKELFEAVSKLRRINSNAVFLGETISSEKKALWIMQETKGTIYPSDLSKILNVTTPRVTKILNQLEDEGLIERAITTMDRRKVAVSLSEKGEKVCEEMVAEVKANIDKVVSRMTIDECKALIRFVDVCETIRKENK